jgi:hypothetical protein
VTDQYADPMAAAQARVSRLRKRFSRFAGIVLALVGVVALVIGGVLLASQRWPLVQATVQSCQTRITHTTGSHRSSTTDCAMVWQDSSGVHTATVGFNGHGPNGPTVALRVHGATAVEATPIWAGWVTLGVGFVLASAGVIVVTRSLRRRTDT